MAICTDLMVSDRRNTPPPRSTTRRLPRTSASSFTSSFSIMGTSTLLACNEAAAMSRSNASSPPAVTGSDATGRPRRAGTGAATAGDRCEAALTLRPLSGGVPRSMEEPGRSVPREKGASRSQCVGPGGAHDAGGVRRLAPPQQQRTSGGVGLQRGITLGWTELDDGGVRPGEEDDVVVPVAAQTCRDALSLVQALQPAAQQRLAYGHHRVLGDPGGVEQAGRYLVVAGDVPAMEHELLPHVLPEPRHLHLPS